MKSLKYKNSSDCHFDSDVAEKIGVPAAMIFSRMFWSIEDHAHRKQEQFYIEEKWWMYDTAETFRSKFKFFSLKTINRAIGLMEGLGLVFSHKMELAQGSHKKWYSINWEVYEEMFILAKSIRTNCPDGLLTNESKCPNAIGQNVQFPDMVKMSNSSSSISPTLSHSSSLSRKTPVDNFEERLKSTRTGGREEKEDLIELYETKFQRMTSAELRSFEKNLAANASIGFDELKKRVVRLSSDPLLKVSTSSPNRIFFMDEAEKWVKQATHEVKSIAQRPQIRILGQFSVGKWASAIQEWKSAKKLDSAPLEAVLDVASKVSFGVNWDELSGGCETELDKGAQFEEYLEEEPEQVNTKPEILSGADFFGDMSWLHEPDQEGEEVVA